jgi:hypothetical protein
MPVTENTWPEIRRQYRDTIEAVCRRAVELKVPALLVEFETLPAITERPRGAGTDSHPRRDTEELSRQARAEERSAIDPNDTHELERPPLMRRGRYWDGMRQIFHGAAEAGASHAGAVSHGPGFSNAYVLVPSIPAGVSLGAARAWLGRQAKPRAADSCPEDALASPNLLGRFSASARRSPSPAARAQPRCAPLATGSSPRTLARSYILPLLHAPVPPNEQSSPAG